MTSIWKPTPAQCALIRSTAAHEARAEQARITLDVGVRCSDVAGTEPSMNLRLLGTDGSFEGTDLFDYADWSAFKAGVPLDKDGRAIVDFYIMQRRTARNRQPELLGNVVVHYEAGRISRIRGYARLSDYPGEE